MRSSGGAKETEAMEFLRASSAPWLSAPSMSCAFHKERSAFSVCPHCGRPLCEACATSSLDCCKLCRDALAKRGLLAKAFSALCQPALWVLLCIAVAAGLYALGVGNPGVSELQKMDSAKEWHMQEAPKVFLAQGARERKRASVLAEEGNSAEAARWYAMASESYAKSASLWGGAESAFAPALAAADALSRSGQPKEAFAMASKIKPPSEELDFMDYHFAMGKIALAAGDSAAAKLHFQEALSKALIFKDSSFDGIIAALAGDRKQSTFAAKVRAVSGLGFKPDEIIFKCRKALGSQEPPSSNDHGGFKIEPPDEKPSGDFQIEILQPKAKGGGE